MSISSNTLVPKDVRGKKLAVKSGCRGFMVAAMYLDKWHGAARFILREVKPVCVHATGEVTAKIHHRSNKPEVTPTILELIKIGIAHIESNLPVADESVTGELKKQISDLDMRLKEVESKLSGVQINNTEITSSRASNEN